MSTVVKDLGPVTAYADAVAAGYTGTKEEWQALMASYASVAEEAQEAKEGAEAAQEAAESARDAAMDAKEGAEDAVDGFGAVVTQATNQAVQTVRAEGTTQVGNVSSEGTTQVNAVQAKGAEVLQSIPEDYTELSNDVVQLKEDLTAEETARESADDAINAELATKADTDGAIASAEQLLSDKYTIDQVPYTFRASGGNGADREYDEIVGGSIAWNQLCNGSSVTVLNGHKYYMLKGGTASIGASTGSAITGLASGTDMVSDLTQMFGTTVADYIYNLEQSSAGAGVAFFRKLFPEDYYEYNAGEMMHVSDISAHEMVGFNLFDEASQGYVKNAYRFFDMPIGKANRLWMTLIDKGTSVDLSNTSLGFVKNPDNVNDGYRWVLHNGTYGSNNAYNSSVANPSDYCAYMFIYPNTLEAWNKIRQKYDICINLHWDGERDGEYEPYVKHSYPLDDSLTLRGIPKLDANNQLYYDGDIYAADGTVTRKYGIVDLGTLTWTFYAATTDFPYGCFWSEISDKAYGRQNILCTKYPTGQGESLEQVDKQCLGSANTVRIYVVDSAYTDDATFKAAMSGVMLVYELATPTTEEAEPYTNPQIVDPYGTEEYVTTSLVPVGHYTKYPANIRSAIERVMEQVPEAPSANGTYVLKATKTSSGVTYAWVAE